MTRKQKTLYFGFVAAISIVLAITSHYGQQWYENLDRDSQILASNIALSIIGLVIFAFRNKKGIDKDLMDALEVLVIVVFPAIDAIYIFKSPISNLIFAIIPYLIVVTGWFIFFLWRIYRPREIKEGNILNQEFLNQQDELKKKKTAQSVAVFWGLLLLYGVTAVWLSMEIIPLVTNSPSGH